MKYLYLSHILTESVPAYGGRDGIIISKEKTNAKGNNANTYNFSMHNHLGTHIDAPNHFFEEGKKISDYPPETWFFEFPKVIRFELEPSEILEYGDWTRNIDGDTDILLFNSGWVNKRETKSYIFENPGIHPEVGIYLRKNYPNLRAIGIDWISISSYSNRNLGREAHAVFLDPQGINHPLFIIEDMNLSHDLSLLKELVVFPLLIKNIDSSPCTAIGRVC